MGVNPTRHVCVQYVRATSRLQQQSNQMPIQKGQCFNASRIAIEQRQHFGVVERGKSLSHHLCRLLQRESWKRVRLCDFQFLSAPILARGHVTGEAGRLRVARQAIAPAPDRYANAVSRSPSPALRGQGPSNDACLIDPLPRVRGRDRVGALGVDPLHHRICSSKPRRVRIAYETDSGVLRAWDPGIRCAPSGLRVGGLLTAFDMGCAVVS